MRDKYKKIKDALKRTPDYAEATIPLIERSEGFSPNVYLDSKGIPTIGSGLNLNDPTVRQILVSMEVDPDALISGATIPEEKLREAKNIYLSLRDPLIKEKIGTETFEKLPTHQKAAIASLGFQSLNNLGPKLKNTLEQNDPIGAIKEITLGTNPTEDPGTQNRRMREAYTFGGPLDFSLAMKDMEDEERRKITDIINKNQNPNTREHVMNKYGSYLKQPVRQPFSKIQKVLSPSIEELINPEKLEE